MLELTNVEVRYDEVILVLKGLSLSVAEGRITALLGPNGAGKTTSLKAASGLLEPDNGRVSSGSIEFRGHEIHGLDASEIVRRVYGESVSVVAHPLTGAPLVLPARLGGLR